ncbi:hypothetical protein A2115_02945 [Candidatus Woesebacteria bacterium GWA1_41_8]|uniref:ArnT-like N-terminal domain-containing protein n=1 Tax=Candidatus Woesebacteria bacterium GWA1_41_8 TaxID=1802471 RepID=A0A1F7WHS7_9BACT|nr:MAG: hypothetical protein A2115_02945 [Candidatus Woesebacteria bacterium GWA1_41_8]
MLSRLFARISKIKRIEYYLLALIIIGGFGARLYKINNPIADWHSFRQADTASVSRIYVEEGINLLFPRYHDVSSTQSRNYNPQGYRFVEFPLYNAAHALLAKTFGLFSLEVWGRLTSIFFWVGSTLVVFALGVRFIGRFGGVLSAFFYSFLPYNIYFTRVILPEPAAIFFGLLGLWLFVLFIDNKKDLALWLSGLSFAVALLIKPFMGFYLVPAGYLLFKSYPLKTILKTPNVLIRYLVFACLIIVPFGLWRIWINKFPAGVPDYLWMFNGDGIRFRPAFWKWIFGERLTGLILGFWGIVLFVLGLISPKSKSGFINFFLLGMFAYVAVFATVNVRHDYYQLIAVPTICLAVSRGFIYLWETREFGRLGAKLLAVFSVFIMFVAGAVGVKEFYKINHPEIIEAGEAIDAIAPKDAMLIAPYNGDTAFLYQTKRRGWPVIDTSVDEIIQRGADYYVTVSLGDADTSMITGRFEVIKRTNTYLIVDLHKPKK